MLEQLFLFILQTQLVQIMSMVQEEFEAFENNVDEVMKILNFMSSDDKKTSERGMEIANK